MPALALLLLVCLRLHRSGRCEQVLGLHTDTFFALMCVALGAWGISQGMAASPMEALMADSVPTGIPNKQVVCELTC